MHVRPITVDAFFSDPAAPMLMHEYAQESSIPGMPTPVPQQAVYCAMEATGGLSAFGAFEGETLIGFVFVLTYLNPHYGAMLGVSESLFVTASMRHTGAGMALLHATEECARQVNAVGLLVSAPSGGRLADVLAGRSSWRETNRVFFKGLDQ